jgi:thiamine-phosphate pyrophosphorylase
MKVLFVLDYAFFGEEYLDVAKNASPYCDMLWLRIKDSNHSIFYKLANKHRKLLPLKKLILSSHTSIAIDCSFDGVQLTYQNALREWELIPKDFILGCSAHDRTECEINTTYKTLSPIFSTAKGTPLGLLPSPADNVYAMGGINMSNVKIISELGYYGVAGISFYRELKEIYAICSNTE